VHMAGIGLYHVVSLLGKLAGRAIYFYRFFSYDMITFVDLAGSIRYDVAVLASAAVISS